MFTFELDLNNANNVKKVLQLPYQISRFPSMLDFRENEDAGEKSFRSFTQI
jgi:hypothetical protein